jgi:hypothetical protein
MLEAPGRGDPGIRCHQHAIRAGEVIGATARVAKRFRRDLLLDDSGRSKRESATGADIEAL